MITKAAKGFLSIISKPQRSYYNLMREIQIREDPLPLYTATPFKQNPGRFVDKIYEYKELQARYLKLIPFLLEDGLGTHNKKYVLTLELYPNAEALNITYLNFGGVFSKVVDLKNFIPVIYEDFLHGNRRIIAEMPLFLDTEMIYYNIFAQEFYVFDKDGAWNEKNVEHPVLDLSKRFSEKKWYDTYRVVG